MPGTPLVWDDSGNKKFELGTKNGVLFVMNNDGTYADGVAWNGLTGVTETTSGGDETALWADDIKYGSLYAAEQFGATIEAYQCPPEFYPCDGSATIAPGVTIDLQPRQRFGFAYISTIGNDTSGISYGYKIHLIYNAVAQPSERAYATMNESPDAMTLSWEVTTIPIPVANHKPTAHLIIDSTTAKEAKLTALKTILFGSSEANSRLPLPNEVATLMAA